MKLNTPHLAALDATRGYARARQSMASSKIAHVLKMSNLPSSDIDEAIASIRQHARVGLHFHPDRLNPSGRSVAEMLLTEGYYKNQFETLLSNGKLAPQIGSPRDDWENNMFGDAYGPTVPLSERPKYGALNLMLLPDGPSPRFGSCYLLLKPSVLNRCTFTYMDSHLGPPERGTIDLFDDIIASLLVDSFEREFCLGVSGIRPPELLDILKNKLAKDFEDPSDQMPIRNLDFYIEAQLHGPVNLRTDADLLVTDPSFDENETGSILKHLAEKFNIGHFKHRGFSLSDKQIPSDFRGSTMPSLAQRISVNGIINAKIVGDAAIEVVKNPKLWCDRGTTEEVLQELKQLWHILVRFG